MTFKSQVSRLLSFADGGLMVYIKAAIVVGIVMFVGFLYFSRADLQRDLKECQKANIEAQQKLTQITQDLQEVRVKQELGIQERAVLKENTNKLLAATKKQVAPKDCKNLVKWAADNKADTAWPK